MKMKNEQIIWKTAAVFMISLVIFLPFYISKANAFEITSASLRDSKGFPVSYVGPALSDLFAHFVLNESSGQCTADLSGLNERAGIGAYYKNVGMDCSSGACNASVAVYITQPGSKPVSVTCGDETKNTAINVLTDFTKPVITSFVVGKEHKGIYYVGKTNNYAVAAFIEDDSGILRTNALISREHQTFSLIASGCDSTQCRWGPLSVSGTPDYVTYVIRKFQDRVGNIGTGVTKAHAKFDGTPPKIEKIELTGAGEIAGRPVIMQGDTIQLKVFFIEETTVSAEADFSQIIVNGKRESGNCRNTEGEKWMCEWNIGPAIAGYAKRQLNINWEDLVGNKDSTRLDVEIYGYRGSTKERYVTFPAEVKSLNHVDRELLSSITSPWTVYFPMKMDLRGGKQIIQGYNFNCEDITENAKRYWGGNLPKVLSQTTLNPLIVMKLIPANIPGKIEYNCSYTVIVADSPTQSGGKYIYPPETGNFKVIVTTTSLSVGEYSDSVDEKIAKVRNSWLVKGEWLNDIFKAYQVLDGFCTLTKTIQETGAGISSAIAIVGTLLNIIPGGQTGDKVLGAADTVNSVFTGKIFENVGKGCDLLSCRITIAEAFGKNGHWTTNWAKGFSEGDWFGIFPEGSLKDTGVTEFFKTWGGLDPEEFFSPKNSLITSFFTLCLSGILVNFQKARDIECGYIYCMENLLPLGVATPYICDQMRASNWCKFVWGEIFSILPYTKMWDFISSSILNFVSNPISSVIGIVIAFACKPFQYSGALHGACALPGHIAKITKIINDYIFYAENWDDLDFNRKSFCDLIGE